MHCRLDFSNCKYNPPGVSLNLQEVNSKSQELQTRMRKQGLKIGRFEDAVCWYDTLKFALVSISI